MSLINPGFGLIIWMTFAFLIVLFILAKYAWKPIMNSLKEREDSIEDALRIADETRKEMENLKLDNEKLLKEAKGERDAILREARKIKERLIEEAKEKANTEAARIVESAKQRIETEKGRAMTDIKNTIAKYALEIAEKVMKEEFKDKKKQSSYIEKLLDETRLN
ncbi:MAG TPA: F0F1 ATP synthase subunit B [Bacteroidetes bacterium]|nr:F0F1 ATP synthase subunit B [Bacteroidota bacterium]